MPGWPDLLPQTPWSLCCSWCWTFLKWQRRRQQQPPPPPPAVMQHYGLISDWTMLHMSEATVKHQRWLMVHREHQGLKKHKPWGAAGGKLNFTSRGTDGIRGLGDSWTTISLASYFLTADRGLEVGSCANTNVNTWAQVASVHGNDFLPV